MCQLVAWPLLWLVMHVTVVALLCLISFRCVALCALSLLVLRSLLYAYAATMTMRSQESRHAEGSHIRKRTVAVKFDEQ